MKDEYAKKFGKENVEDETRREEMRERGREKGAYMKLWVNDEPHGNG